MGYWKFIVPEATTNMFSDPSFALPDPDTEWTFAGDGTEDFTRNTSYSYHGFSGAQADLGGGTYATVYQAFTVTATSYTLSAKVRRSAGGTVSSTQCQAYWNTGNSNWDSITALRDGWYLCVKTATPTAGSRSFGVRCREDDMYVDGVQLENKAYRTTYCDGEQEGCSWVGTRYASASKRSAQSRAGGRIYDFEDLGFYAETFGGIGMPPVQNISMPYALPPGSEFVRTKVKDRVINLGLWVPGTSLTNLHSLRQDLIEKMGPDLVEDQQSFILRYSGATVEKEIRVHYEAGLELGDIRGYSEVVPLRLWAEDPHWYALGNNSVALDSNDSLTHYGFLGRVDGVWTNPGSLSAGGTVYALAKGPDGCIYIGGDFTNWDGTANADYIVKWDPVNETYSALGTGMAGGAVRALAFGPDGTLYAGGAFTGAGGVSNTDEIAAWNGSAWTSMGGAATNGTVYALAVDLSGKVYAGGAYTSIGGTSINRIARWDGVYWADVGGANDTVFALCTGQAGEIYAGGDFTTIGNRSCSRLASFDGTSWTALGSTVSDSVLSLAMGDDGTLYIAGEFTEPYEYICSWNGVAFAELGTGYASSSVGSIVIGPDNRLYAGGVQVEEPGAGPASSTGWWDPDGEGLDIYGAWKAKGASSYTASKVDTTGQGHDLTEIGGSVDWDSTNGWKITYKSGKLLMTGFIPNTDQTQTVIVQFSNASSSGPTFLVGTKNSSGERFTIRLDGSRPGLWVANGADYTYDSGALPSNICVAGDSYFLDGVDTGSVSAWTSSQAESVGAVAIGAQNYTAKYEQGWPVYIQGVAIYNETLTSAQVAKVEDEMQAW